MKCSHNTRVLLAGQASNAAQRLFALAAVMLVGAIGANSASAVPVTTGLQLQLDATNAASLTTVSGAVSQWDDLSGNNRDFRQLNPIDRPLLVTDNVTQKSALRFDNGGLSLFTGGTPLAAGDDTFNYFVVWKPHVKTNFQTIYGQGTLANNQRAELMAAANDYGFTGHNNDARFVGYTQGDWRVTSMAIDAGGASGTTIVENNGTFTTGNPTGALNISSAAANVGANAGFGERFNGDIAEILVYDSVLSAGDRTATINFLAAKYNLLASEQTGLDAIRHRWSFTTGADQLTDSVGTADITNVVSTPTFAGDTVTLDGGDRMSTAFLDTTLREKTLVAWVANTDLNQAGGGGVLGVQQAGSVFDSIVYAERTAGQWMNGSNFFQRTPLNNGGAVEISTAEIMLAIVYNDDNSIDIYREGLLYASYTQGSLIEFLGGGNTFANFGSRFGAAGPQFDGILNEARIYGDALTAGQIATLFALGPDLLEALPDGTAPEPSTLVLAVLGLVGLALGRRRRRRSARAAMASLLVVSVLSVATTSQAAITDPTSISGNTLWLDAADTGSITIATGVSSWTDKSTKGTNTVTQADTARQPVSGGTTLNGKNVLTLDGGNDNLARTTSPVDATLPLLENDDSYTYFAVWRPSTINGFRSVYEQAQGGGGRRSAILQESNSGRYGFNGEGNDRHNLVPYSANVWRLTAMEVDNSLANNIHIVDNGTDFFGATGNPAALNVGTAGTFVGRKNNNSEFFAGDLAELIVFDRILTDGTVSMFDNELNDVQFYLDQKWGLSLGFTATPSESNPTAPEPSTLVLAVLGLVGLAMRRRRRKRSV